MFKIAKSQPPWNVWLLLAGIPVEGKSSMCLICINNYTILILITGRPILSLSARVKYIRAHTRAYTRAQTCTNVHTCAHTCTHVHTHRRHRLTAVHAIAIRWRPTNRDGRSACDNAGRWPFKLKHELATRFTRGFGSFSRIKKLLGRTETRTRDRMYCQAIRIVRNISRDDRAGIATCSLRTLTDRLKENYSIDYDYNNYIINY